MPLIVQNPQPRVILGLMTFGPTEAKGARITSLDEFNKCLDYFQQQGFNEVDTARVYIDGEQEAFTAKANWKSRGLTLATKWYPSQPGFHKPEVVREKLELSLKELQTDTVDIFYLHAADRATPFAETLEAVNQLHKEGKFVQLGLSNFTAFEVAEICLLCAERGWVRPTIYQAMYNAITRNIETELVPACHRYGLDIVIYNPLAGGLFSGKYKSKDVPAEGRYSDSSSTGANYRQRYFRDATFEALSIIEPVVEKHGLTMLETALRWVRHHSALRMDNGGHDGVLVGVSSFAQLETNLADLQKGPLPEEVVQALDQAWLVAKSNSPNYWHLDLKYTYDTQKAVFGPKDFELSEPRVTSTPDAVYDFESDDEMVVNRSPLHPPTDGRSQQPLLDDHHRRSRSSLGNRDAEEGRPMLHETRRPTIRSRSPEHDATQATRKKYMVASGFLLLSLISFVVQTETASYIQNELHWKKPYCMLYMTHGSWSLLWLVQLGILRLQKRKLSWDAFWRRHVSLLRSTAQMVESQEVHLSARASSRSPVPYMLKTTAFVTTALTVAGGSWYVAVNMTTASDLTAIYNCSAFFAYAFSIPLLNEKLRFDKVFSVAVATIGVMVVAYGDRPDKKPSKGGEVSDDHVAQNRLLGNIVIGIGSILYGLYEVLYKRFACPPEGTSPGRGTIFANTFGSLIGVFTLLVLWIPLPFLHWTGWETFEWPTGEAAWMLIISVGANATFSGSFLVLISLTSPVLSSVAALLTIFLVALVDWFRTGDSLSMASIIGGILIMVAFFMLSFSTYREMNEEQKKHLAHDALESDSDA
ncbi:Drug/metabolite transporter [Penicillium cf. griseofulvum]|uniref:Drug/metabolite transporter n=1 Tax=Penicillium cf. griseofulvum TaxID=2972120 RepID=A0A9W9M474_9EURO|nr:Drug/metabolite transporter [Penicillium cf. griseofulvum]KAJ5434077.1 Drug/metabolite transporter [Penicillium cf. griseofulvum]